MREIKGPPEMHAKQSDAEIQADLEAEEAAAKKAKSETKQRTPAEDK